MRSRLLSYIRTLRARRVLLVAGVTTVAAIFSLAAFVALLPTLLSTSQAQSLLRLSLSKSLKKPVSWSNLSVSWSDGIALSGLTISEGAPPLLHASLGDLHLVPGLSRDRSGRYCVSLDVKLKKLQASLVPGPPKPPEGKPLKDPLTRIAEGVQQFQTMDWPLPVDVNLSVDAAPMTIEYSDPATGRKVALRDFSYHLAVPSLTRLPVETRLSGMVQVDGGKPQQVSMKAMVSDLVTAQNRIKPALALFSAQAGLPGAELSAGGGLNREGGLSAKLRLDLPQLLALAAPLAHKPLPAVAGAVALDLRSDIDKTGDLKADVELLGDGIAVKDIPGKKGSLPPLDLRLHQGLVSNHKRQQVVFTDGSLTSPGLLSAAWSATVDRPTEKSRVVAAQVGPVRLDLARGRELAAPFLPSNFPVRELEGTLFLTRLTARLEGVHNDGELSVEGGGVELRKVGVQLASGPVAGEGVALELQKVTIPLKRLTPDSVTGEIGWSGRRLAVAGRKPVEIEGVKGTLKLSLTKLDLKRKRAVVEARQTLDVAAARVGAELGAERLAEQMHLTARALGEGEITANVPEFKLAVTELRGNQAGKKVVLHPVAANLTAEGVHVPPKGKGSPTLRRATCSVSAADALTLAAELGLTGAGRQVASTKGTAQLDLGRLMPIAAPFLPAGFKADGAVAGAWDLAAPLPVQKVAAEQNPLRQAKGTLALLERCDLSLKLKELNLRVPAKEGSYLVQGLNTARELRVVLPRAGQPVKIDTAFNFAAVSGLPGSAKTLPIRSGTLSVQGELSQWKELRLTEELKVAFLRLSQVAELTVGRIDALLDERGKPDAATLLKRLDATLFAHLEGDFPKEAKQALAGWQLSGNVSAGARVDLTAARELKVRGYTKCRDFGVADGKGMAASGIRADLVVDRSYALAQVKGDDWVPLSAGLVRPAPVSAVSTSASDLATRIYQDLRGESSGPRKIGVRSASFKSGLVPLEASALEADLLLEPEALGLSFFQAEVGGGTVRARGMIDLARETPTLSTYCNFSRLDPAILFPAAGTSRPGEDGELTGELTLSAPLATDQRALLEGMRMNLNLRRFSSRVLDRALFAIDPYQRNEKVVAQRKSLRMADLKGLRVSAVDGALDCEGELLVKGVGVGIPKIERLRLSELPIRSELARVVSAITSSRVLLDLVRSDTLVVGPKGELSLKRRSNAI